MVYEPPKNGVFPILTLWFKPQVQEKGKAKAAKCDLCAVLAGGPACVRYCSTDSAMRVSPSEMFEFTGKNKPTNKKKCWWVFWLVRWIKNGFS
jgi:Fe-S-cluster-containing hydrogenase component 2|tara:strand:+ start:470 stop:748 length:279 start_codon:yes stop_codon:yes gene_type:complete